LPSLFNHFSIDPLGFFRQKPVHLRVWRGKTLAIAIGELARSLLKAFCGRRIDDERN
jgi:hypothetical protein